MTGSHPSVSKRKADDEEAHSSSHKGKKGKKRRTNQAPPANADIINLAHEDPATPADPVQLSHSTTRPRPTPRPIMKSPESLTGPAVSSAGTSTAHPRPSPCPIVHPPESSTESASSSTDSATHPHSTPRPTVQSPESQPVQMLPIGAASAAERSAEPIEHQAGEHVDRNEPVAGNSWEGTDKGLDNPAEAISADDLPRPPSPIQEDNSNSAQVSQSRHETGVMEMPRTLSSDVGQREDDLFSNLAIPPPSNQIPQTVAPSGSGSTSKSKKGKPMEPSKALTARNLFAIDYLGDHPNTTSAEFKKVFDALDETTRKKYNALAKQKKVEHGAKPARGDNNPT